MSGSDPIAYTYDADTHCPGCALERFGTDDDGWINGTDAEGNPVGAIAPWDEVDPASGIYCGTCGAEVVESEPWTVVESTPGYLPDDDDPARFHDFRAAVRYMVDLMRSYRDSERDAGADVVGWVDRDSGDGYLRDAGRTHDLGRSFAVVSTPNL